MITNQLDKQHILLVAGDYDIAEQVKVALTLPRFVLHHAFSHRDAVNMMQTEQVDVVLIDSAMKDRDSGAATVPTLASMRTGQRLVLLAPDGIAEENAPFPVVTQLDANTLQAVISQVLRRPVGADDLDENSTLSFDMAEATQQVEEMKMLFALSKTLTEVLDLNEVLQRVVEVARHVTDAEEAMLLMPDEQGGELYLRARVGIDLEAARNFRIKTEDTLAGDVYHTGRPILVGAQGLQKVKTEYFVNSLLYVPILLKGVPIGVLGVNNKEKYDVFTEHHQDVLLNLSSYSAIAIQNARIHEESLQRARELESIVEASQAMNRSLSMDKILPTICEQIARVLLANWTEIYEYNEDETALLSLARFQRTAWRYAQGPRLVLNNFPELREALVDNTAIWIDRKAVGNMAYLAQKGAIAKLFVPIGSKDQPMGAAHLYYLAEPRHLPTTETVHSLRNLALEALVSILDWSDPERMRPTNIFRLVRQIREMSQADWCELSLLMENGESLIVHVSLGNGVWTDEDQPVFVIEDYPDLRQALQIQTAINQQGNNKMISGGARALLNATRARAVLALPLVQRGRTRGMVLSADTLNYRDFDDREMNLALAIVGQAATALENAELVHDLERSLRELHDAQARLVQTARMSAMGELAAVVAHQLNNPLTTIVVDSELLLMDEGEDSVNYKSLHAISQAGKRAGSVARRLLSIIRPNDVDASTEPIDVLTTIRDVLSFLGSHIEHNKIRLSVELPEVTVPPVETVRGQLEDIWMNLLWNAQDALNGQDNAEVGIKVAYIPGSDYIDIVVWDNGPGIPKHIQQDVFNPFFTTKPPGEGTGLGLHISRQVVERAGGQIRLDSDEGKGARFYIRLPVMKAYAPENY